MKLRALLFVVSGAVFASCGDEKERASAPSAPTPVASASETPASSESPAAPAAVTIKGFTYDPARVTVRSGGEVEWVNEDASNHTVTFEKEGPKDVGNLRAGRRATVTFDETGSYAYICDFHPGMAGTVEVR